MCRIMTQECIVADGESLINVIRQVKPTALLGLSGAGPIFSDEIIQYVFLSIFGPNIHIFVQIHVWYDFGFQRNGKVDRTPYHYANVQPHLTLGMYA